MLVGLPCPRGVSDNAPPPTSAPASQPAAPGSSTRPSIDALQSEVVDNIRGQRIGAATIADLQLPDDFLRRAADRIIRLSYEQRYRVVVAEPTTRPAPPAATQPAPPARSPGWLTVVPPRGVAPDDPRATLPVTRPALRGFRASIGAPGEVRWPFDAASDATPDQRRAIELVSRRLAPDGLLPTLALALEALGAPRFVDAAEREVDELRAIGLPTDLLRFFRLDGVTDADAIHVVRAVARRLARGTPAADLARELADASFRFEATRAGFRAAVESGDDDFALLRLQAVHALPYLAAGDGSSADLVRWIATQLPDVPLLLTANDANAGNLGDYLAASAQQRTAPVTIVTTPMPQAPWAQDNGKAGTIAETDGRATLATLTPRYASRGEDGSALLPGDSFLFEPLATSGHTVIHSPLLFQGGNTLVVRNPQGSRRVLLLGEAEVYRNTALGLSHHQTLEAFRVEFGVDEVVVLPATSHHIDFTLTVRAVHGRLVAFVADTRLALPGALRCGVDALVRDGLMPAAVEDVIRAHLDAGRLADAAAELAAGLSEQAIGLGHFRQTFTEKFASAPAESAVGNFQRFMLAIDIALALDSKFDETTMDPHAAAYQRAFRRQATDRAALGAQLSALGWKVVRVPSLADGDRGITYVNGLHDRTRYLMPVHGGLFAPLDEAAAAAFRAGLGADVHVLAAPTAELQRRNGAVHCAVSAYHVR